MFKNWDLKRTSSKIGTGTKNLKKLGPEKNLHKFEPKKTYRGEGAGKTVQYQHL